MLGRYYSSAVSSYSDLQIIFLVPVKTYREVLYKENMLRYPKLYEGLETTWRKA